jgi:RNA polymerase sigma-70 factor (ECF subfamily)
MPWTRASALAAEAGMREPGTCKADVDPVHSTAAALHERYLDDVYRYVLRRVPSVPDAEDITADVFAAAAVGLRGLRRHGAPYLWLLGIARRKIVDFRRRQERRPETLASELIDVRPEADPIWETLVAIEGPEQALVRAEARGVVRSLIAGLKAEQREAVLLHYMEDLSVAESAAVMGRTRLSVQGLLQRARQAIYRHGQAYFLEEGEEKTR